MRAAFLHRVQLRDATIDGPTTLAADAFVVACGPCTISAANRGVNVPIPGKGYSAPLRLRDPARAPNVSMIDDSRKTAISRLGDLVARGRPH